MPPSRFRALIVEEQSDGTFTRQVKERDLAELPAGEVLVRVAYSSLNYKDALSATGNRGVTRNYPHTPGIDAAGIVEETTSDGPSPGQSVIVTSYDLGMNTAGGFAQYIRIPAAWVVPLPAGLSLRESMILGTAGFTAGLSVDRLTAAVGPGQGPVLVTGATGGVGSVAVAILARLGYEVIAVSGKADAGAFLKELGADQVIGREALADRGDRPLLKVRWAGAIDTVGGEMLAAAIKSTRPGGLVTCCGNVASADLKLTVYPFILRGVTLAGIDSQNCPMDLRQKVWEKLADGWKFAGLGRLCQEVDLDEISERIELMLQGRLQGRTLVNVSPG